jgi:hypothetical protein
LNGRSVGPGPLPDELRIPHFSRLPPTIPGYDEIVAAHENAIVNGEQGLSRSSHGPVRDDGRVPLGARRLLRLRLPSLPVPDAFMMRISTSLCDVAIRT